MTNAQRIALMLVVLLPYYGYLIAYAVGAFFAERPVAWEWAKVVIDAGCVWVIVRAM